MDRGKLASISGRSKIIAFQNIPIHGYGAIDNTVVWEIVQVKMPVLARGVGALLR